MRLLTITFVILMLLSSCNTHTKPSAASIADTLSLPKDSLAFYFPAGVLDDRPSFDSLLQNGYGAILYSFNETVLSQHFGIHSVYRFLWLRSFHRPVVFTLHKLKEQVWLTTKMLANYPQFRKERVLFFSKNEQKEYQKDGYVIDSSRPGTMIKYADRKASLVYYKQLPLSLNEWNEFEQLLADANFWNLAPVISDGDTDGSGWIIEGCEENQYHVVSHDSPGNNDFAKAGLYLIKLSGLQEEIY